MKSLNNKNVKIKYNQVIEDQYSNEYEFKRWFSNERLFIDYVMTYKSIKFHIKDIEFKSVFELGPGPGTWTRLLYRRNPNASFDLLDISESMQHQFINEMRNVQNVNYKVGDIADFETDEEYDLFFSSRAIEYIDDPGDVLKRISNLMKTGAKGLIVTKNPSYVRIRSGKNNKIFHSGDLPSEKFVTLLKEAGFSNVKVFPVIFRLPLVDRVVLWFSKKIFYKNYRFEAKSRHKKITESYIYTFEK